ncbi:MAG: hypothetical protein DRH97_00410 [Chloroflexi bacterium]|nr:MAG: hypothetical protein DRH97_00410 [Chloroflexota bacterium]
MKSTIIFETQIGIETEVAYDRFMDKDYVDGICVRCDDIIEISSLIVDGKKTEFEDLRESNKEIILDEIRER